MDFVPLTLFFMVYLLGFQESQARPNSDETIVWPKSCAGKTFCTDNSTYPDVETFKGALGLSGIDLSLITPSIDNRMADRTCRQNITNDFIYLIKDDNDVPWFVVQVPNVHEYRIEIKQCLTHDTPQGFKAGVKCLQITKNISFLVLSHDKTSVETVFVKGGLPVGCSAKVVENQ